MQKRAYGITPIVCLALAGACGGSQASEPSSAATSVRLHAEATERGHVLVIENGTDRPLRLRRGIEVDRNQGTWTPIDVGLLYLRERCETETGAIFEPPACVEIAAGATFRSAQWNHMTGDSQCACEECGPVPSGRYRFAVTECEGGRRYESEAFDVQSER